MRTKKKIFVFITITALLLTMVGAQGTAQAGPSEMKKVIISFHEAPGQAGEELIKGFGGRVKHNYSIIPAIAATVPDKAITALSKNPRIKMIENDVEIFALDAELDNTWGVKRIGAGTVHDGGNLGTGVKVAVIDTGVDCSHIELSANCAGGRDFVNNIDDSNYQNGYNTKPTDDNGHGTHVAGTIAAVRANGGVVGAAPEVKIYAYKILDADGKGFVSTAIAALQQAIIDGVQVTNNSYGTSEYNSSVESAFNAAATDNMMIHVAAAGNSGNRPGIGDNVIYPARFGSVIAVAATDSKDRRASFSSTGPAVEISAPGVSILSAYPGNMLATGNGTSMASPHVAGTVALMLGANPDASVNEIRSALQSTAVDLGDSGRDNLYGYGLIDAAAAVELVTTITPSPLPPDPPSDDSIDPEPDVIDMSATISEMSLIIRGVNYAADATVVITDLSNVDGSNVDGSNVIEGVTVLGYWDDNVSVEVSGITDSSGKIVFTSPNQKKPKSGTEIKFTVSDVVKDGYSWDGGAGVTDSVFIP